MLRYNEQQMFSSLFTNLILVKGLGEKLFMIISIFYNFSTMNGSDGGNTGEIGDTDGAAVPTREDLIAMVEKDVAFSMPQNRIKLFNHIRKLTCEEPSNTSTSKW